jgi:citrate lyase subunit alpha/citrate CoA-transferase
MALNSLGRFVPEVFNGIKRTPYNSAALLTPQGCEFARPVKIVRPGEKKLLASLREAIIASGLKDGMTIATHHHLRNGDSILNQVVKEIDALGIRNITIASSSVHPVHAEIIPYIKKG